MEYQRFCDGPAFVVRWRAPTVEAARRLAQEMLARHRAIASPLFMAILIGPDCSAPDARTRDALMAGHERVFPSCSSIHLVLLEGSLRQDLMRAAISNVTLATGLRGKGITVDRSLESVLSSAAAERGIDGARLLAGLHGAGLLDDRDLSESSKAGARP